MNFFDCHLHIHEGLENYYLKDFSGNIIFNQVSEYKKHEKGYPGFTKSLIFDYPNYFEFIKQETNNGNIKALKIHSRIQKLSHSDLPELIEKLKLIKVNVPIIYDAFYFGSDLDNQPSLKFLIELIKTFPNKKFIVAHSGGYEVLKYFFHLRTFKNVGYDLSFSLQYLSDTSCYLDLVKLCRYTEIERLFFGSDYPYANPKLQFEILTSIGETLSWSPQDLEKVCSTNWLNFINNI